MDKDQKLELVKMRSMWFIALILVLVITGPAIIINVFKVHLW